MKWGIIGALALAVAFAILWFWSRNDLDSRYRDTLAAAREIGVERSGELPSDERVRERLGEAARQRGLTLAGEVLVSRSVGDTPQPKAIDRMMRPAGLVASGTTIAVEGRLQGKKLLWKLDKPFVVKIVIRGNITPGEGGGFDARKPLPTSGDHLQRFEEGATRRGQ